MRTSVLQGNYINSAENKKEAFGEEYLTITIATHMYLAPCVAANKVMEVENQMSGSKYTAYFFQLGYISFRNNSSLCFVTETVTTSAGFKAKLDDENNIDMTQF